MKSCPTCKRTFDDTMVFCLVDGSILSAPFDSGTTLHLPNTRNEPPPTEVMNPTPAPNALAPTVASPLASDPPVRFASTLSTPAPEYPTQFKVPPSISLKESTQKSRRMLLAGGLVTLIAIIAIVAFISNRWLRKTVATDGSNVASATKAQAEIIFSRSATNEINSPANLSTKYLDLIRKVDGVGSALPVISYGVQSSAGFGVERVEGVDWESYATMNNLTLISGRGALNGDEVMIDETKARDGKISVGDELKIFDRPFRVTGIYGAEFGARMKIPFHTMEEQLGATGECTYILIKCLNTNEQVTIAQRLNEQLPGNRVQFTRELVR